LHQRGLYLESRAFCETRLFPDGRRPCEAVEAGHCLALYNWRMSDSKLVVLQSFASQMEADLAKSVLESAGIDALVQADRAGGMRDHLAWSGFGFKILVREEDAESASHLLHPPHAIPDGKLVVLRIYGIKYDAEIDQGMLESAGIAAAIEMEPIEGTKLPFSPADPLFRLLVREEDVTAARTLLGD
jgi:hypothetical protein